MDSVISQYFEIRLNDLHFYSHIGVSDQERKVGNEFSVDISIRYSANEFIDEDLSTTISYADIYDIIKQQMNRDANLLETIAKSITSEISKRWNTCFEIQTEIYKINPPISGIIGNSSVKYFYKKNI